MNEYQVLFGKRLKFFRKQRNWTQEELAEKADLDRTYVASIERGERNVSLLNIVRLAEALEIFPGELFKFSQANFRNQ
ncbi:MAG: helix-turn-helix transcriptional regulator [Candidatus Riflebacteria bacterium]|nr:helix-turn-helix transcriptional regulator [Candidatus Riflebacteria bacterium]